MNHPTTRSVLLALTTEDRPWTIDELVRDQGNHIAVITAIDELNAIGLVNRINERVVCASRAAIHAEDLRI
jgi:hypothetical protein